MNYFFSPVNFEMGQNIVIPEEETHHAIKVLRLTQGQKINILNGKGQYAEAEIIEINQKRIIAGIRKIITEDLPKPKLSIGLGLLKKKDRLEWFIEKAVELGIARVILFSSDHTEKFKADERRIEKIAISALKQSGNRWLPEIKTGIPLNRLLSEPFHGQKFIAHCADGEKSNFKHACKPGEDAMILIGPEGDFSDKEINLATENNFVPVSLGNLRLRSETAAFAALMTYKLINEN